MTEKLELDLKKILRYFLLILSFGFILYFFIKNHDSLQIAVSLDAKILIEILFLQCIFIALQSWRFQIIIEKCSHIKLPFWPWTKIFVLGRFLNLIFTQAGNIYRGVQLKAKYGITYTHYISAFSSMAWIDTCMNLLIALVVVLLTNSSFLIGPLVAWHILSVLFIAFFLGPILLTVVLKSIKTTHPKLNWIHSKLSEVLCTTIANLKDFHFLCKIFGLCILLFLRTIVAFQLYFLIFGTHAPLVALVFFYAIFKLGFFITLTPGNLGVQEIAWGFLSEQMGIGMEQGILLSGLSRVISSSVLILSGFALGGIDLLRHSDIYKDAQLIKNKRKKKTQ